MSPENPFKQKPFEVDPEIKAENERLAAERVAYEAEHGMLPLEQLDPREYYVDNPDTLTSIEEGLDALSKHPEAYELAFKLSNPHIPLDDFFEAAGEWNEDMNRAGQPAEGLYRTVRFPFDGRIDRKLAVKIFENGRVTFSFGGTE